MPVDLRANAAASGPVHTGRSVATAFCTSAAASSSRRAWVLNRAAMSRTRSSRMPFRSSTLPPVGRRLCVAAGYPDRARSRHGQHSPARGASEGGRVGRRRAATSARRTRGQRSGVGGGAQPLGGPTLRSPGRRSPRRPRARRAGPPRRRRRNPDCQPCWSMANAGQRGAQGHAAGHEGAVPAHRLAPGRTRHDPADLVDGGGDGRRTEQPGDERQDGQRRDARGRAPSVR